MSDHWLNRVVLVTGATGFIGSHLVEALLRRGAAVRILARPRTPEPHGALGNLSAAVIGQIDVRHGSVVEPEALRTSVRGAGCVFHLAALMSVPYSYEHPSEVLEVNARGTLNALMAAREAEVERVIVISSSEVYGTARRVPIDEDHPFQAQSMYAASKIAAEKLAESFWRTYGLRVTVIRPFNTYGPRQSLRAVIPTIVAQALFSEHMRLGNLKATRDFTYVGDVVEGLLAAAESRESIQEVLNLGSGREISIGELAERVKALTSSRAVIEHDGQRLRPEGSEVQRLCANADKARRLLGWSPRISLEEGLRATIKWIKETTGPEDAARYHY
jgi:nucleoside-diphosphate-sugar epimerase